MPRCMVPFLDALELIRHTKGVGVGCYRKIQSDESTLDLKKYDDLKNSYKVIIRYNHFQQEFILGVKKEEKEAFKKMLEECLGD